MSKFMYYQNFLSESFTITSEELPIINTIADDVYWNIGDRFAFVDFNGIKNIPIRINNKDIQLDSVKNELSDKN